MLYDNALLVPPYLHAWLVTGEERYRVVAEQTLDYMVRELRLASGGLASAQDADTDGVEGLTYTWTEEEGAPAELLQPFEHGRSILRGELDDETRARLLEIRERRPQPSRDDKVIASWNGLALAALAEGARRLERHVCSQAAVALGELLDAEPLWRTTARRPREVPGVPRRLRERRARALRAARRDRRPPLAAREPRAVALARGRALRRPGARRLLPLAGRRRAARRAAEVARRQPDSRRATRCSRSSSCGSRGSGATTSSSGRRSARCASSATTSRARRRRSAGRSARSTSTSRRRASSRSSAARTRTSRARRSRGFDPNVVVAFGPADDVPLLEGKDLVDGKPAVYVCERFACRAPVTDRVRAP